MLYLVGSGRRTRTFVYPRCGWDLVFGWQYVKFRLPRLLVTTRIESFTLAKARRYDAGHKQDTHTHTHTHTFFFLLSHVSSIVNIKNTLYKHQRLCANELVGSCLLACHKTNTEGYVVLPLCVTCESLPYSRSLCYSVQVNCNKLL